VHEQLAAGQVPYCYNLARSTRSDHLNECRLAYTNEQEVAGHFELKQTVQ
jgi:hypothetical protein